MERNKVLVEELQAEMAAVLDASGILVPALPPWIADRIDEEDRGELWRPWGWRSHESADPWWCYSGTEGVHHGSETSALLNIDGDFFIFAHAGRGMNSYGLGLVARIGSIAIEQQILWGGAYVNEEEATARVNASIEAWNASLPSLLELATRRQHADGALARVRFSDYRGWSEVGLLSADGKVDDADRAGAPNGLEESVDAARQYLALLESRIRSAVPSTVDAEMAGASSTPRSGGRGRGAPGRGRRRTRVSRFRNWLADRLRRFG